MFDRLTGSIEFHGTALVLRGQRQQTLAANIANADTPGYVAKAFKFEEALRAATVPGGNRTTATAARADHLPLRASSGLGSNVRDLSTTLGSADRNTVDMDAERAKFAANAVHYEATLRFINGSVRTMLSAIQGQ